MIDYIKGCLLYTSFRITDTNRICSGSSCMGVHCRNVYPVSYTHLFDGYNKAYAIKSASEYFAESYKDYKEHPSALRSKRPRTYQFVKSTIDGITDSDVQNIKDTYGEYLSLIHISYYQREEEILDEVKSAVTYPVAMLGMLLVIVAV